MDSGRSPGATFVLGESKNQVKVLRSRVARLCHEEGWSEMSPYAMLGSSVGTAEAASLCVRVMAWHDAMVAHERRLRTARTTDRCDEECPHVEARTLWSEALATLGPRASELTFLRSRANGASPSLQQGVAAATDASPTTDSDARANRKRSAQSPRSVARSSERSQLASGEL